MTPRGAAAAAIALAVVVSAVPAVGSIGTGVGSSPVILAKPAKQGRKYILPRVYLVNTGTERTSYRIEIKRLPPNNRFKRAVPPSWIKFSKRTVTLEPGQATTFGLLLKVPKKARPARYDSEVVLTSIPKGPAGATALGVASATSLQFRVVKAAKKKAKAKKRAPGSKTKVQPKRSR